MVLLGRSARDFGHSQCSPFRLRRLIYTLRQYPNTEDFVYLRRLDRNPSDYNPYALEVVPFSELNSNDFYVLSVRGITHHLDGTQTPFFPFPLPPWIRPQRPVGVGTKQPGR